MSQGFASVKIRHATTCDGMGRRAEGARQCAQRVFRSLDSLAELAKFDLGITAR